jgi:hypothetical protein
MIASGKSRRQLVQQQRAVEKDGKQVTLSQPVTTVSSSWEERALDDINVMNDRAK